MLKKTKKGTIVFKGIDTKLSEEDMIGMIKVVMELEYFGDDYYPIAKCSFSQKHPMSYFLMGYYEGDKMNYFLGPAK